MKRGRMRLLICILVLGMLFGCVNRAEHSEAVPATAPTAEPTPEPAPDPAAMIADAEITAGKHEREDGYRDPFKTHVIDTSLANVQLMDGDAYSDEKLQMLTGAVLADILTIAGHVGETPRKVTVYIIWNLLQDRPVVLGDHMICSAEQVENGTYREALCGVCFDLPVPWEQVGLYEIVFGTPDENGLKDFYANEDHALTASCAAVYFLPEVAGEETAAAARQTAASMTAYLLRTGGFDALRAAVSTAELLSQWTAALGIETPITLPDGHERAAVMIAYRDKTPNRICVFKIGNFMFQVNEGGPVETADELYVFACRFVYGLDFVLAQIREESPYLAEIAETNVQEPIRIALRDDPTQTGISYGWNNEIELVNVYAAWHEMVHALLIKPEASEFHWMTEGLAEHFSNRALSMAVQLPEMNRFEEMVPNTTEMDGDTLAFYHAVFRVYHAVRASDTHVPAGVENEWAFRHACGICELLLSFDPTYGDRRGSVGGVRGAKMDEKAADGNALSYQEATVMLEYLFDTYGTERIAEGYMNNRPLSELCGKDYPELYADCIAYLNETYGSLLAVSD